MRNTFHISFSDSAKCISLPRDTKDAIIYRIISAHSVQSLQPSPNHRRRRMTHVHSGSRLFQHLVTFLLSHPQSIYSGPFPGSPYFSADAAVQQSLSFIFGGGERSFHYAKNALWLCRLLPDDGRTITVVLWRHRCASQIGSQKCTLVTAIYFFYIHLYSPRMVETYIQYTVHVKQFRKPKLLN